MKRCLRQKKRTDFEAGPRLAVANSIRQPVWPNGEQERHDWRARTAPGNRIAATVVRWHGKAVTDEGNAVKSGTIYNNKEKTG